MKAIDFKRMGTALVAASYKKKIKLSIKLYKIFHSPMTFVDILQIFHNFFFQKEIYIFRILHLLITQFY